jgi:ferredoxin
VKKFRVRVDPSKCICASRCTETAPDVFAIDENEGTVKLLLSEPPPDLYDKVLQAAALCPTQVIEIDDLA